MAKQKRGCRFSRTTRAFDTSSLFKEAPLNDLLWSRFTELHLLCSEKADHHQREGEALWLMMFIYMFLKHPFEITLLERVLRLWEMLY